MGGAKAHASLQMSLAPASSRSWAVKLEAPETFVLEVLTTCNVSELYFDVKKMLKSNQGMCTQLSSVLGWKRPDRPIEALILCAAQASQTQAQRNCAAFPCLCA